MASDSTPGASPRSNREALFRKVEVRNALLLGGQGVVGAFAGPMMLTGLASAILVRLGGTDVLIGLLAALGSAVAIPGMILGAHIGTRSRRKAATALGWNLAYTSVFLPPVLLLLFMGTQVTPWGFAAVMAVSLAAGGLCGSVGSVVQVDLLSRITVPSRRGRVTGMVGLFSGGAGLAGGVFLSLILGWFAFPKNYALASSLGVFMSALSCALYVGFRELPDQKTRPGTDLTGLRGAIDQIRRDRAFLWVLLAAMLKFVFNSATIFVLPTALRRQGLDDSFVGHFAVLTNLVSLVISPVQGWSADRLGIGRTACAGGLIAAAGMSLFAQVDSANGVLATSGMLLTGSLVIGGMFYLAPMAMSPPEHRSSYVAARYLAESVAGLICAPIAGWAITAFDPAWVFHIGSAAVICSGALLALVMGRRRHDLGAGESGRPTSIEA